MNPPLTTADAIARDIQADPYKAIWIADVQRMIDALRYFARERCPQNVAEYRAILAEWGERANCPTEARVMIDEALASE